MVVRLPGDLNEALSLVARGRCKMPGGQVAITESQVAMSCTPRAMTDALVTMTCVDGRGRIREGGASICMATQIGGPAVPVARATNPIDSATVAVAVVNEPVGIEDASGHLNSGDDDVAGG
jgi:hypothetical protein